MLVRFFSVTQHHYVLIFGLPAFIFYYIGLWVLSIKTHGNLESFQIFGSFSALGVATLCAACLFYCGEKKKEQKKYRVEINPGAGYLLALMFVLIGIFCFLIAIAAPILMVIGRLDVIESLLRDIFYHFSS